MLFLKRVTLENFLSHENTALEFKPDAKVLLDGPSGVGKSSLADAILWALYGVGRSDNRSLVRKGCKKATVRLVVWDETTTYTITRSVTAEGKHTLDVTSGMGEGDQVALPSTEGLRGLQAWIESTLIGASYLLFINSVAYLQGGGDSFVGQTASKRKDLLLELVKADDFDTYYEKAKEAIADTELDMAVVNADLDNATHVITRASERIGTKKGIEASLEATKIAMKLSTDSVAALMKKVSAISSVTEKVEFLTGMLASATERVERIQKEIIAVDTEYPLQVGPGVKNPTQEDLDNVLAIEERRKEILQRRPQKQDYLAQAEKARKRLEVYTNLPVCPSGDLCPHQHASREQIQTLEAEVKELERKEGAQMYEQQKWDKELSDLPPLVSLEQITWMSKTVEAQRNLPAKQDELIAAEQGVQEIMEQLQVLQEQVDLDEKIKMDESIEEGMRIIEEAKMKIDEYQGELAVIAVFEKDMLLAKKAQLVNQGKMRELMEKHRKLLLVKEAFGSKGIKTVVIDYILPKLEDKINEVLAQLSDFRIRLDTQRTSADGENQVEGLFITIINDVGEELAFENYSGGEKLKITVAISEALASLQKVSFRIFDEMFVGLDEVSTESFANVLAKMQTRFGQVICISHLPTIKDLFDDVRTVSKQGGISSVDLSTG